jgi:hypothetical protein
VASPLLNLPSLSTQYLTTATRKTASAIVPEIAVEWDKPESVKPEHTVQFLVVMGAGAKELRIEFHLNRYNV